MTSPSNFERLASINVNEQVEKKGGLSYLSWAWALDRLLRADPEAKWWYGEIMYLANRTAMVFCTVKAFGMERTMQLPVMDYKNRAIVEPDAFAVNTAMQRALVKAIALHGLGLYIYAGEDLPPGEEPPKDQPEKADAHRVEAKAVAALEKPAPAELSEEEKKTLRAHAAQMTKTHEAGGDVKAYYNAQRFDDAQKMALWLYLPPAVRAALKAPPTPLELGSQG